jgi:hypothetical protein
VLNKSFFMRALAAFASDAAFAYTCYGFLPNVPIEFWSRRDVEPEAHEPGDRDQVRQPRSVRSQSSAGTATRQGPLVGPI